MVVVLFSLLLLMATEPGWWNSFSAFHPSRSWWTPPEQWAAAVQHPGSFRCIAQGHLIRGWGLRRVPLPPYIFLPTSRDSNRPPSGYRSNSLTSEPRMPPRIRRSVLGRAGQVLTRMEAGLIIWTALAREEDMAVSCVRICSDGVFCRKGPTGESLVEWFRSEPNLRVREEWSIRT